MADVTVIGGGIFGLSVAWACARRGARVRLLERDRIGAGASGGLVGAMAPHVPENWNDKKQFQLQSLQMAQGWWVEVANAGGIDPGYARLGRLQPLGDEPAVALAHARAVGAATHWGDAARWEVVPANAVPGLTVPSATGLVVHDTLSARIHPRRACAALAAALRARGAELLEGAESDAALSSRSPTIWATGWEGLAQLRDARNRPAGIAVKGQAALLRHAAPDAPQILADGLHIVPHADGTVGVGATTERDFTHGDTTDDQLDALLEQGRALCPPLRDAPVIERWAGLRPRARSRGPLLGAWPGRAGHFIANGAFKIGFGIASQSGEAMADLVLEGRDAIPPGFRPDAQG